MVKIVATGADGRYTKEFDIAAQILIKARANDKDEFITLSYLYKTLGADTPESQNGVQWAVRRCKDAGIIKNTDTRAVYEVA